MAKRRTSYSQDRAPTATKIALRKTRKSRIAAATLLPGGRVAIGVMPLISRGLPAYGSTNSGANFGATYAESNAVDGDYATFWRTVTGAPAGWLALDLSGIAAVNKTSALLVWFNDPITTDYMNDTASRTSGSFNTLPYDYKIQGNAAAGGGAPPGSGWVDLVTVTANLKHSRQHTLDLSAYNWVRINVTNTSGVPAASDDVSLQVDIYNVAGGQVDNWLFLGDSITAEGMGRRNLASAAWTNGPLAVQIGGGRVPLYENGGTGGKTIAWADTNKAALLSGFGGKYVVLAFGTNDATGGLSAASFDGYLQSLLTYATGLGKTVILPRILKRTDSGTIDAFVQSYNAKIVAAANGGTVLLGPDLYSKVNDGTIALRDGLHPTYAGAGNGYEAMQVVWRDWLRANLY